MQTAAQPRVRRRDEVSGRSYQAGFSIGELLAACAAVTVLSLAAIPAFSEVMQVYSLHGAVREVYSQLQKVRMTAVTENTRFRVKLNESGKLMLHQLAANQSAWVRVMRVKDWPTDSPGVKVAATNEIVFAPNGTAPQFAVITLSNPDGKQKKVVVRPGGAIRIE